LHHNRSTLNELMADITRKEVERLVKHRSPIKEVNITALNLDKFNFEGAIFTKCKFTGSTFNGSDFAFSHFEECLIDDCEMYGSHMQESSFIECDLSKSDLRDCILIEVNFRQSILHSGDFSGSFIKDSGLLNVKGDLCDFSFTSLLIIFGPVTYSPYSAVFEIE